MKKREKLRGKRNGENSSLSCVNISCLFILNSLTLESYYKVQHLLRYDSFDGRGENNDDELNWFLLSA